MAADRNRIKGIQIHRAIVYGSTATVILPKERAPEIPADHTYKWTVNVRSASSEPDSNKVGGADDLSYFVKRVTFKLHESYPNATRHVDKSPFEITETGWGEFEIQIKIAFTTECGEKPVTVYHHLKLHPWAEKGQPIIDASNLEASIKAGPVHSYQYDEIVFSDPFQSFYTSLTSNPSTPLPAFRGKPVPYSLADLTPGAIQRSLNGVPEYTSKMIEDEKLRLEASRQKMISQESHWRTVLIEKETELAQLRKKLEESTTTAA